LYLCLCNALTDRMLLQAASAIGSIRPGQVYAACGCRLQCAQCVRAVAKLLREHAGQPAELPMAAE
jgi:bacterioferritin-associated ferredoxin